MDGKILECSNGYSIVSYTTPNAADVSRYVAAIRHLIVFRAPDEAVTLDRLTSDDVPQRQTDAIWPSGSAHLWRISDAEAEALIGLNAQREAEFAAREAAYTPQPEWRSPRGLTLAEEMDREDSDY